ncbi:phosphoglycerol transferase [Companilactobacillus kimchiensis]|uniref:Phosphoglycerol transferase n=1 Tax=Companilactobacillus kimchiensis TaxID=993692 RepID=A0A0R2LMP4_9LACO|nr:phosphoglycerol transferase [Companilactobacillus kimchiensis]
MGLNDAIQYFIAVFNPFGPIILILSLSLYFIRKKVFLVVLTILYFTESLLLYSNVLYYREFSNFLSASTIFGAKGVMKGLGNSILTTMLPHDFIYLIDILLVMGLFIYMGPRLELKAIRLINAVACTMVGIMLTIFNLSIAEMNRPQLLGRTFDQTYTVKYLGLNFFLTNDIISQANEQAVKSTVSNNEISVPLQYVTDNYATPNKQYYGVAHKKNVIVIHLESFQQFLINMKVNGQEVTPFLNSLYGNKNTVSFDNFFHEVGQGKTSDAETMLESGLFGLPTGSFFTKMGPTNTFQSAPAILGQTQGYTSAVFHGNVGSFYSRDSVYKNMGYNYFFDQQYFDVGPDTNVGFGLKDKLFFAESTKYLEKLQQPFYAKFITLTNHYSFDLPEMDNDGFVKPATTSKVVNNYFETAHYLDASLREFFDYLRASGLYDKSMIILYGDHYGISDDKIAALAPLMNKEQADWNEFDTAQMQRVPFMIHMKGIKGKVDNTYGGEIDVLPTLLHLLGINNQKYLQFGSDLFSKDHDKTVIFRNGNFINKNYTSLKNSKGSYNVYDNTTGQLINLSADPELNEKITKIATKKQQIMTMSDDINSKNLLRFYTPTGFKPVDPSDYEYTDEVSKLDKTDDDLGASSTSLYSQNNSESTVGLYKTDAPEYNK